MAAGFQPQLRSFVLTRCPGGPPLGQRRFEADECPCSTCAVVPEVALAPGARSIRYPAPLGGEPVGAPRTVRLDVLHGEAAVERLLCAAYPLLSLTPPAIFAITSVSWASTLLGSWWSA